MNLFFADPFPTPTNLDASTVTPGPLGAAMFTFLAVSTLLLLFSLNRRLKKIKFIESTDD